MNSSHPISPEAPENQSECSIDKIVTCYVMSMVEVADETSDFATGEPLYELKEGFAKSSNALRCASLAGNVKCKEYISVPH